MNYLGIAPEGIKTSKTKGQSYAQCSDSFRYNDNIEFFFAASQENSLLWHLIVSAGGKTVAREYVGKRWNWALKHHMKFRTRFFENGWKIKAEFAKSDFRIPAGKPWAFTVVSNRYQTYWVASGIPKGGVFFCPRDYLRVCP